MYRYWYNNDNDNDNDYHKYNIYYILYTGTPDTMIYSTKYSHHHLLRLFTVCTVTTMAVVSGFGCRNSIDPSLLLTMTMTSNKRGGRRRRTMRHKTTGQLWSSRHEDGDGDDTPITNTSVPVRTIVSSNSNSITDDKSTRTRTRTRTRTGTVIHQEEAGTPNDNTIVNDDDDDDRAGGLRKLMASLSGVGGKNSDNNNNNADNNNHNHKQMLVGSTVVVSGPSLPHLGLEEWQSYELVSVYDQGVNDINGLPIKISRTDLNEEKDTMIPSGYKRYCTLYSERYHKETGPVVVSPDEIQLVSVQDEIQDSLLMALPIFGFWTALAISFANSYNARYGGNFLDALFRTHGL